MPIRSPAKGKPVLIAEDRSLAVPPGHIVETDYVHIHKCRLANRTRMAVGDVASAFHKRLNLGDHQPFPPPNGYWEGDTFVILDGRHEYIAALMLGFDQILVAWVSRSLSAETLR